MIDLEFRPYVHQRQMHRARLAGRFMVLVWHRRAGKTVFSIMELLLAALNFAGERGRFAYIAPFLKQSKTVAWEYLKAFAAKVPGIKTNESELSVAFPNGAQVRLYGGDNAEALRGIYLDGVVLDEVADMRPEVWGTILRPALADHKGWAIFIGTPKGVNLFSELYFRAQSEPEWIADLRRADQTGVIEEAELAQAKREMTEAQYAQEFSCDFAAAADDVLMRLDDVLAAQQRVVLESNVVHAAKVLGVDCARYGADRSCIFPRRGQIAYKWRTLRQQSLMDLAGQIAEHVDRWQPDAVFIDVGGMGTGVVDRCIQLNIDVIPVDFGSKSHDERFENKRAEMWWEMAEWVREFAALPSGNELVQDLTAPKYTYKNRRGRLQLESKDDMRARGLPSPDVADALATTFASPVMPKAMLEQINTRAAKASKAADYDPYQEA